MPASSLNLLRDPWLPVRRRSGVLAVVSVAEALGRSDDPAVAIDWSRADFDAAALEFLVGLMSTVAPPETSRVWRSWWNEPPTAEDLVERLAPFAPFFELDGPGPRFLQDLGDLGEDVSPVSRLIIDQPGENALKNNTDLFQRRGQIETLSRSTAAIALFTLQCFAPSGGKGHRTSLRGGGPLTTLVGVPNSEGLVPTLWRHVWLNVVPPLPAAAGEERILDAPGRTFPWLAPTRTSDKSGGGTYALDIHPLQCFWGMPRRIRLEFEASNGGSNCDVTGRTEQVIVRKCKMLPLGVEYVEIEHPLTPYYKKGSNAGWLPVLSKPDRIAWRFWPGYVRVPKGAGGQESRPAAIVEAARTRLADLGFERASLRLHGYSMDKAKAVAFVETAAPFFIFADDNAAQDDFEIYLERLVATASQTLSILTDCLKSASGRDGGVSLDLVRETFWAETELRFRAAVEDVRIRAECCEEVLTYLKGNWIGGVLLKTALATFDREVPIAPLLTSARVGTKSKAGTTIKNLTGELGRAVEARRNLIRSLHGWGKSGADLWKAAGLEPPASSSPKPKKGAAR